MPDKPIMDVLLTPQLIPLYPLEDKVVVVIDVLRATTTMTVALDQGATKVIPVETIQECLNFAGQPDHVLAGERNGVRVEGFDYGNSPFEFMDGVVQGKTLVLTTTNGTRAIRMAHKAHTIAIGGFLNYTALCQWLRHQNRDVVLLCSGWKDKFNLEDTVFAGSLLHGLHDEFTVDSDAAFAAEKLYVNARKNLLHFMKQSSHYRRLKHLGVVRDIQYCLRPDLTNIVPVLRDNALYPVTTK